MASMNRQGGAGQAEGAARAIAVAGRTVAAMPDGASPVASRFGNKDGGRW